MLKFLLATLGTLSLVIGIMGIFIPGLPTTPFILLTAGLYVRSSDKLYKLLIQNPYLGRYIKDFHTHRGLSLKTKIYSITLMWIMIFISAYFFLDTILLKWLITIIGIIGTIVMGYVLPTIKNSKH